MNLSYQSMIKRKKAFAPSLSFWRLERFAKEAFRTSPQNFPTAFFLSTFPTDRGLSLSTAQVNSKMSSDLLLSKEISYDYFEKRKIIKFSHSSNKHKRQQDMKKNEKRKDYVEGYKGSPLFDSSVSFHGTGNSINTRYNSFTLSSSYNNGNQRKISRTRLRATASPDGVDETEESYQTSLNSSPSLSAETVIQDMMKGSNNMNNIDTAVSSVKDPQKKINTKSASSEYSHTAMKWSAEGLPLVYDAAVIEKYWSDRPLEMSQRWSKFVAVTAPFITSLVSSYTRGTLLTQEKNLARDLRIVLEKLGPTFVKLGQALSIRPDIIGPAATEELAKLQDSVKPFDSEVGRQLISKELAEKDLQIEDVFEWISEDPVASASLAQVYQGKLKEDGSLVAVKVQRPEVLEIASKDLYVMRRAVEVYDSVIVKRFTAQTTDYLDLLRVWATGFYEELDFTNEMKNQDLMRQSLVNDEVSGNGNREGVKGIYIPKTYPKFSTRRLLVTEWVDGIKLTQASKKDIQRVTKLAQEAFLKQLLEDGRFHSDPHPGNLMLMKDNTKGELCILDFGLIATLNKKSQQGMVNALIHTANKDFPRLIDDLIELEVLPKDCDRVKILPVMKRVIGPYVFQGGGAKNLDLQSLTIDLGRATVEIPFSIPSYFALIARALGILEGIALTGDEDYKIVLESYPYVTRRLLTDDAPAIQKVLQEILYPSTTEGEEGGTEEKFSFRRLTALLTYAMQVQQIREQGMDGIIAQESNQNGIENVLSTEENSEDGNGGNQSAEFKKNAAVFVDFDSTPISSATRAHQVVSFLLSENAGPIRNLIKGEAVTAIDLLVRQQTRLLLTNIENLIRNPPTPPLYPPFLPRPRPIPQVVDFFLPSSEIKDQIFPVLSLQEELYVKSIVDLSYATLGVEGELNQNKDNGKEGSTGNVTNLPLLSRPFLNTVFTQDEGILNMDSRNLQVLRKLLDQEDDSLREEVVNLLRILDRNTQTGKTAVEIGQEILNAVLDRNVKRIQTTLSPPN